MVNAFQIFDGLIREDNLLQTYCGSKIPKKIVAESNILRVQFVSDEEGDGEGFSAMYSKTSG